MKVYEENNDLPIKTYKYRLILEVYDNLSNDILDKRFCLEARSTSKDKKITNELLKESFDKLIHRFNIENKGKYYE